MEDEFLNATEFTDPHLRVANSTLLCITCLFGGIANLLIVVVMFRYHQLKVRTNLLLANYALFDLGFIIFTLFIYFESFVVNERIFCFYIFTNILLEIIAYGFLTILVINKCIGSQSFSLRTIYAYLALLFIVVFCLHSIVCWYQHDAYIIDLISLYQMCFLTVVMIYKEAIEHRPDNLPVLQARDESIRLNIGRIVVYNNIVGMFCDIWLTGIFTVYFELLHTTIYLSSFFVLIYMLRADANFYQCVRNLVTHGKYKIVGELTYYNFADVDGDGVLGEEGGGAAGVDVVENGDDKLIN